MTRTYPMTCIAPTIADCLGVRAPEQATGEAIPAICDDLGGAQRIAILAPDALGEAAFERFREEMPFLRSLWSDRHVTLRAEMPSITPVNFTTMITGCDVRCHGMQSKELPVQCETLFDVLGEAGEEGAGCGRPGYTGSAVLARLAQIDGTAALPDDAAVEEVVLRIARERQPAFIIAQIGGTDDHFHRFGPESLSMIPKLREMDCRLERMVAALGDDGYWIIILSDHGQHESGDSDMPGTHGTDCDEDRLVPCTWVGP